MRNKILVGALAVLLAATPIAAKKDNFPAQIIQARYLTVLFLSASGPSVDTLSPNLSTEDRDAMAAVETAFRDWKRYSVTPDPRHADIIVAVRTARQSVFGGATAGSHGHGPIFGADAGPNVDMMEVYGGYTLAAHDHATGPLLWRGAQRNGLKEPELALVKQFRERVEEAARNSK
jgi:hypothetical protein